MGVFAVGDLLFGIPVDHIREVVPAPKSYHALPEGTADFFGAIVLRDHTIPVKSLRRQFGLPDPDAGEVIVILQSEQRSLGILVDRACELVRNYVEGLEAVHRRASDPIGDRWLGPDGRPITLVNVARLFDASGVVLDSQAGWPRRAR
nr:chemotaxis protein CheW [Mesobacterium pallidum]